MVFGEGANAIEILCCMVGSFIVFKSLLIDCFVSTAYCWSGDGVEIGPLISKQILDEVFVISGIIKVKISVISRAEGRG